MDADPQAAAYEAVAAANRVCLHVAGRLGSIQSLTKDDRSPVTVADFASQAAVVAVLRHHLGDVTVVGEESSDVLRTEEHAGTLELVVEVLRTAGPSVLIAEREAVLDAIAGGMAREVESEYWTLDPIDGTKGFLRGGQYAVSLAHVDASGPRLGVLGCPNLSAATDVPASEARPPGTIFQAARGQGVVQIDLGSGARRSLRAETDGSLRIAESVESGHTRHDHSRAIAEHLGLDASFVRLDGQGKYAVVARGQANAYLRMPTRPGYREKVWDHAAGVLVALEAGCTVTDIRGQALDFSTPPQLDRNRGVVCARPGLHERLLQAIEQLALFPE